MTEDVSTDEQFEPLRCTCFRVRKAARRLTQAYESAMAEAEASPVQMAVLTEVARFDGPVPVNALAHRLGTDRTTLSRTLTRLTDAGWLREKATSDARQRALSLTAKGQRALDAAGRHWRRAESRVLSKMGREKIELLFEALEQLEEIADVIEEGEENRRLRKAS